MKTGLFDRNGTEIKIGDTARLVLEDGAVRDFSVVFKTVKRTVKSHPDFDDEFATVNITGVVFCWEGYDLFPCVGEDGVSDVSMMEVVSSKCDELIEMVDYDGEPVPKELCSIDRAGGADDFFGCGACFMCEGHMDCSECAIDKMFKHYAKLTGQDVV